MVDANLPIAFNAGDDTVVDVDADTIALVGHGFEVGAAVVYDTNGTVINGLTAPTTYFVIPVGNDALQLAATRGDALAGIALDLIDVGIGATGHTLTQSAPIGEFDGSGAFDVDIALNTIVVPEHRLTTGQAVVYANGGDDVGGLVDGTTYFAINVSENVLQLATSFANAVGGTAIDLTALAATDGHTLTPPDFALAFDAGDDTEVDLDADAITVIGHGLVDGQRILYSAEGGTIVGGLDDDRTYFAIVIDTDTFSLATTQDNALAGTAVDLTVLGETAAHTLERTAHDALNLVGHGFNSGQALIYDNGGGTDIDGLTSGLTYFAIVLDADRVALAATIEEANAGTSVAFGGPGTGAAHTLDPLVDTVEFDPSNADAVNVTAETLTIVDHGLVTGQAVVYDSAGRPDVGGLVDGTTYFAIVVDEDTVQLAETPAAALSTGVTFDTETGNGDTTSIVDPSASSALVVSVFDGSNGATVDIAADSIVSIAHGLLTGTAVVYGNGGGTDITGLVDGDTYYVIALDDDNFALAASEADAFGGTAVDLSALGTGITHTLEALITQTAADSISLASHGLVTGDAVVYNNGGDTDIGGLTGGETYFAIVVNADIVQLAASEADALGAVAIDLTSTGTGANHSFDPLTVHTVSDTVTFANHGFVTGDAVLYDSAGRRRHRRPHRRPHLLRHCRRHRHLCACRHPGRRARCGVHRSAHHRPRRGTFVHRRRDPGGSHRPRYRSR